MESPASTYFHRFPQLTKEEKVNVKRTRGEVSRRREGQPGISYKSGLSVRCHARNAEGIDT